MSREQRKEKGGKIIAGKKEKREVWKEIDSLCARRRKKEGIKVGKGIKSHLAAPAVICAPLPDGLCRQVLLSPASRPAMQITARGTSAKKTALVPLGLSFLPASGGSVGTRCRGHVACKPPACVVLLRPGCLHRSIPTKSCPDPLEERRGIWDEGLRHPPSVLK